MPKIAECIDVSASPSAVSDVLLDIDAAPLWTSGLERLELIAGTVGEPGSAGRAHYIEGSRRYVVEDRLVESTPGSHFKSEIQGGGLKATVETNLDEISSGTRLCIRWDGVGTNPLTRVILPFMKRRMAKRTREDLESLRNLVERRSNNS